MDRFLIHGSSGTEQGSVPAQPSSELQTAKMADGMALLVTGFPASHTAAASVLCEEEYSRIAQAVAMLLSPTITSVVDRAVTAGIDQLYKELRDHAGRISEADHRI